MAVNHDLSTYLIISRQVSPSSSNTMHNAIVTIFSYLEYKHIPDDSYVGSVIDDLSNSFSDCVITYSAVINYIICVHSRELNNCFIKPCDSSKVFPSFCKQPTTSPVSLEVNGIENGTVVTIFCETNNCTHTESEVMLFNIQIRKYKF